jgi:hypothetical protein
LPAATSRKVAHYSKAKGKRKKAKEESASPLPFLLPSAF